jgi:hypothetical protein
MMSGAARTSSIDAIEHENQPQTPAEPRAPLHAILSGCFVESIIREVALNVSEHLSRAPAAQALTMPADGARRNHLV